MEETGPSKVVCMYKALVMISNLNHGIVMLLGWSALDDIAFGKDGILGGFNFHRFQPPYPLSLDRSKIEVSNIVCLHIVEDCDICPCLDFPFNVNEALPHRILLRITVRCRWG